jgi:hypothetical protein
MRQVGIAQAFGAGEGADEGPTGPTSAKTSLAISALVASIDLPGS